MKKKEKKKEKKKKDIVIIEIDFAAFVSSGGSLDSIARSLCWTLRFLFLFFFVLFSFFPTRTRNVALRGRNPPRLIGRSTADHSDDRTVVLLVGHPRWFPIGAVRYVTASVNR